MVITQVGLAVLMVTFFGVRDPGEFHDLLLALGSGAGTTILLIAFVFLAEQGFTRRVAERVAAEVVEPLERRLAGLAVSIAAIQDRLDERLEQRAANEAAVADALGDPTYETVVHALVTVYEAEAFVSEWVPVQAEDPPRGAQIAFSYGWYWRLGQPQDEQPTLLVRGELPEYDLVTVLWAEGDSYVDVGEAVNMELRRQHVPPDQLGRFHWGVVTRNLKNTVETALGVDPHRRLQGTVIELIDDWAVTTEGLEHAGHGCVVPVAEFPPMNIITSGYGVASQTSNPAWATWQPTKPEWANSQEWELVVRLAKRNLPPTAQVDPLALGYWRACRPHEARLS